MKKVYTFLGLPASGKGTQAQIFAQKHNLATLSVGELIREKMRQGENDDLAKRIKISYDAGKPAGDEDVFALIREKIAVINNGIVFDNFPFTKGQMNFFIKTFAQENGWETPELIYIKIDQKSAVERITKRTVCPKCKKIFKESIKNCDKCGEKLETRPDDNPETVRKRIEIYKPQIDEMVNAYKKIGSVHEINGEGSIPEVTGEIDRI